MSRDLVTEFALGRCVECRACSESCPSCRNGGVDPQLTIYRVLNDQERNGVWKCLQCHRCTMACPRDIDVAGTMLALREIQAMEGNVPDKILRTASAFVKDGCISLPKGRMEVLRKELGLFDVVIDEKTIEELNEMLKMTGFFYE